MPGAIEKRSTTIAKLPDLGLPQLGEVQDPARPVLSYDWRATGPHKAASHRHPRAHVIAVASGAYWVKTPEGTWLVPEGLAVWIPPNVPHEVYSHGVVRAQILFVDEAHTAPMPASCGTVVPSALMRAAMSKIIENGNDYGRDGPEDRLARVMLDELAGMTFAASPLPVSNEPRVARVMQVCIDNPLGDVDIERLALAAGASSRNLARLFKAETGMTLGRWRTNLRLQEAIRRLAEGATVTDVAFGLGYSSASAFTHMFRKNIGVPPRSYREPPVGS